MYDVGLKKGKETKKVLYVLIVMSIICFISWLVFIFDSFNFETYDATAMSTKVVINTSYDSENNITYTPTYYYTIDGKEYKCSVKLLLNDNPGTDNQLVYYNSKNPTKCVTDFSKKVNFQSKIIISIFTIMAFICIFILLRVVIKEKNRLMKVLNKNGRLIKNIPYHIENAGNGIEKNPTKRVVVDYKLPSGVIKKLYGNFVKDNKKTPDTGVVDLLIDENNPNDYYISNDINRVTGNLPTDYYDTNKN